jgi:hypothetical protein
MRGTPTFSYVHCDSSVNLLSMATNCFGADISRVRDQPQAARQLETKTAGMAIPKRLLSNGVDRRARRGNA